MLPSTWKAVAALWLACSLYAAQNAAEAARGEKLFLAHCAGCHGPKGDGGKGANLAQPRLLHAPDDQALYRVITQGIPGTEMPYTRFTEQEARQVMAYVRSLGRLPAEPLAGDPKRGERLYQGKGRCAQCHSIAGRGGAAGPDLTNVGARRNAAYLRTALTDPEAEVPDNFTVYRKVTLIPDNFLQVRVLTRDGRRITGIRVNEDSFSIQIRDLSGRFHSFLKEDLQELHKDWGKSPMPSYRAVFTSAELEDIVAYLASLRGRQ